MTANVLLKARSPHELFNRGLKARNSSGAWLDTGLLVSRHCRSASQTCDPKVLIGNNGPQIFQPGRKRSGDHLAAPNILPTNAAATHPANTIPVVSHGFVGSNTLSPKPALIPPRRRVPAQTRSAPFQALLSSPSSSVTMFR
jgi:hypothetical protein